MSVTFKVKENDKYIHTVEMELTDTMMNLKTLIINNMKLDMNYIDLNFLIDRPIRGIGKMSLNKGILPRTMDNFAFNRYNIEGKEILCEYIPVTGYTVAVSGNSDNPKGIYMAPGMKTKLKKKNITTYNLNSEEDFPSL